MKIEYTDRGFAIVRFTDLDGSLCSLQESSLASESAIWFGVSKTASGDEGARMHATYMMTLDVARAIQAFTTGDNSTAFAFVDLYGNRCALRGEADQLLVGVVETDEPGDADRLMRLDQRTAAALLPYLASFLRTGGLADGEGPELPKDRAETSFDTVVAREEMATTAIDDTDVSVQDLLDEFVNLIGDLGEEALRDHLGHDRAKALAARREELAALRSDA